MPSARSADGTSICYQRTGNGPPLVLVHGTADDHSIWQIMLPALTPSFTVYAVDRRGRGGSTPSSDLAYTIEREFEDIVAVTDAIGEPAHLLGHSYGAICALEAALWSSRLRSLILYEPPLPIPVGSKLIPPGVLARMENALAERDLDGVVLTFARDIAQVSEAEITVARSSPTWQATVAAAPSIVDEVRAVQGYAFDSNRFRNLTIPTLLLLGSESPPFLRVATEAVAAALPNSRLVVLHGQGHLAMLSNPDLLVREVTRFLTEVRAQPSPPVPIG